ncbi:hypothetical protein P43SY_007270 [Pythium insidiosum]|uniref:Uncharacterized protein n=1 Tax=Pythium insidiosum TaxID=114742 RepID=A0AAD5LT36_PYTIN|nr:hypothetical protein P43SY_007270 [Pythium insidiosum]KAJ0392962.1 hypothetical protein ATCC90586_003031 [Pythium insidiosum]
MGVFAKESLIQVLAGSGCFSVIQMILLIILGALLVANSHYHQLLSYAVKHAGGGLIFVALLYTVSAGLGYISARTQNKCLLLANLVVLALLVFLQMVFASVPMGRAKTRFSFEQQLSCLTVGQYADMTVDQRLACDEFFRSDTFAGMSLVWQSYYVKSVTDGSYRAMVLNFQKENFCCGNGLPLNCVNDTRAFPSTYPAPALLKQRRLCEARDGSRMYIATKECRTNGRCEYELPNGTCGQNPVTSTTRGCGAFLYRKLSRQVEAISLVALFLLSFPITFIVFTLCLCFKRRDEDIVPGIDFVSKIKIHVDG